MKKILSLLIVLFNLSILFSQTTLIPYGSTWKYLDNGTYPGATWISTSFTDASWAAGAAELGYGDNDETTVVSYGSSSSNKYITTYFRKTITISNPAAYNAYAVECKYDDGVVVYINGTEVGRSDMPSGTITNSTLATASVENKLVNFTVSNTLFISGTNTIAVEIHQNTAGSSDISFDFRLSANIVSNPNLVRGPYLQSVGPQQAVIRWRSLNNEIGQVKYGLISNNLNQTVSESYPAKDHIITIPNLTPQTKYYYSIGSTAGNVLEGDTNNYVITQPVSGTTGKYRFWVLGDCGSGYQEQKDVRDNYINYVGAGKTDGCILLGDNAYFDASDSSYQFSFFDIYKQQFKNMPIYQAPGNHEYMTTVGDHYQQNPSIPYFHIFSAPTSGECGGVPSGSQAYYSFDVGNVHFLSLDSYGKESISDWRRMYDTTGPQAMWVKQDLATNTLPWVVLYWHHPPYTMGTYDSDADAFLTKVRQNFIKMVERYNVDLIVCGHSHVYERSKLMQGHYGYENTFNANTHHLSSSSGLYDGSPNSCLYVKNNNAKGIIYSVAGSAGKVGGISGTSWPHDAMYFSNKTETGALIIEVENNKLEGKWLCEDNVMRDKFTIMKNVNQSHSYTINAGSNINLTASWPGSYSWSHNSSTTQTVNVSPIVNTTYIVNDQYSCIADTFHVTVIPATIINENNLNNNCDVIMQNGTIALIKPDFSSEYKSAISLYDITGRLIYKSQSVLYKNEIQVNLSHLETGNYILNISNSEFDKSFKIFR